MTSAVVTVHRLTPYKEMVRLLPEHRVSSLPVPAMAGRSSAWYRKPSCGLCATECPCGAIEMEPEQA